MVPLGFEQAASQQVVSEQAARLDRFVVVFDGFTIVAHL